MKRVLTLRQEEELNGPLDTFRLGISGPPGAGKSTFIEAFGMHIVEQGHRLAVLAIGKQRKEKKKELYLSF